MAASTDEPFIRLVYVALHMSPDIGCGDSSTNCLYYNLGSQNLMQRITKLLDIFLHKANNAL